MVEAQARAARGALLVCFLVQGACFAVLVTRIPALQDRYHLSDTLLTVLLAVVPVVAGAGSATAEALAKRFGLRPVLRCVQPVVCVSLIAVGAGSHLWQAALSLLVFGLALGAVDATANMQGVALQQTYGRSIMLGFHAAFSLGGILGASVAWAGAHWHLSLVVLYALCAAVGAPVAVAAGHWYTARRAPSLAPAAPAAFSWRPLFPLCAAMAIAYIADSTVSNWSAKYLQDVLHSSDQLSTVPYNAYLVATLAGRSVGDLGVRRWGPAAMVRCGAVVAAAGFAVVAVADGAWVGLLGFTVLGAGLCVVVPQTFAAAGRLFDEHGPDAADAAVARLNIFNYVGVLLGSPLVGALGGAWSYRAAMAVPMLLVLLITGLGRPFRAVEAAPVRLRA